MSSNPPDSSVLIDLFVERIAENEKVWALKDSDGGFALCQSVEDENVDVVLFWSDKAAAQAHRQEDWAKFTPVALTLQDFVDNWLRGLHFDGILVGPDWGPDLDGPEVSAEELARRITE